MFSYLILTVLALGAAILFWLWGIPRLRFWRVYRTLKSPEAREFWRELHTTEGRKRAYDYIAEFHRQYATIELWEVCVVLKGRFLPTLPDLREKIMRAFNCECEIEGNQLDPVDVSFLSSEAKGPRVASGGPLMFVALPPYMFEVACIEDADTTLMTFRYSPSAAHGGQIEEGYRWTGKIAAEFVNEHAMLVGLGESSYRVIDANRVGEALRSDDPIDRIVYCFLAGGAEEVSGE